jgi:tetratricopeptide (TPR) repeat protein
VIGLALIIVLAGAPANDAAARAERHFAAGEYEAAIAALEEAYAAEPDRAFVFAMGSAWQALGKCDEAVEQYERFLDTQPPVEQAGKARERIASCRPDEAPPPVVAQPRVVEPVEEPREPVLAPAVDERRTDGRPWHRDPVGGTLLGIGLAAAVGGTTLEIVGARRRIGADDAMGEGEFRTQLRQSNVMQGVGIGLAVTGGALIVGAVIRYVLVRRGRSR